MNVDNENQKLQQLVTTAHDLFMRFGIRRVSIEEICREANVSKMTFYKHFKNKIEITKYILTQIYEKPMIKYRDIMAQETPYAEKVKKIIELKHNSTNMIGDEFFQDFMKNPNPEIAEFLARIQQEAKNEILNDFKIASKNGDIRPDVKPEFIVYFINNLNKMMQDQQLLKLYNSPNELIMELVNMFFYGVLPPKSEREV